MSSDRSGDAVNPVCPICNHKVGRKLQTVDQHIKRDHTLIESIKYELGLI